MDWLLEWDRVWFRWIHIHSEHPFWRATLPWLEKEWHFLLPIGLVLVWLAWKGKKRERFFVLLLLVTLGVTQGVNRALKHTFQRIRPLYALPAGEVIPRFLSPEEAPKRTEYSFPSGHTAFFFALATFSVLAYPKLSLGVFLYGMALLVAFSRIYLGAHYPLDVIAGALLGAVMATLMFLLLGRPLLRSGQEE